MSKNNYKKNKRVVAKDLKIGDLIITKDLYFWNGAPKWKTSRAIVSKKTETEIFAVPIKKNKKDLVTLGGFDVSRFVQKADEKILPKEKIFELTQKELKTSNISKNELKQLKEKIFK